MGEINKDLGMDYQKLFFRLNQKLAGSNLTLRLHCVGGFVLEYYGLKATNDIDAFYESSEKIDYLIKEVGEEFNVGTSKESWLNHAVGRVMSISSEKNQIVIFQDTNLSVTISSLESVLIDKLQAGRTKDIWDVAKIMQYLEITQPDGLLKLMMKHSEGETDPAIILEAYSIAYGKEALKEYLRKNPDLMRLLK